MAGRTGFETGQAINAGLNSSEMWVRIQAAYDLWLARLKVA